ncbi:MAG: M1 family metallopeptidase [Thermodesulfobacteriota bacterium]|nr:M1 family metallopeptidase [Thermodesulfobacteriota bacterium]
MNGFIPHIYKLSITPDLVRFRFAGRVEIFGEATTPTDDITLHALELDILHCRAWIDDRFVDCSVTPEQEREQIRIRLPQKRAGDIRLEIVYQGVIDDRMAGFYRSRYEVAGETRYVAVTQFQESDARRAFPCQDHPAKKATFNVELIVDDHLSAFSNTAEEEVVSLGDGKKRVRFKQTPPMSTYLLFFGVGAFETIGSPSDGRVRAVTIPGMTGHADYGLAFGPKALRFCEEYFRIPFPLSKMDLIAIPDFAFGAMENWGAITFRENLLLHFPEMTSRAGEERICEVIAHEIVHQWFGNLVTPTDWKYLWLNETFATFFGYGVVDHYHPAWGIWEQFLVGQTDAALARDGLQETVAIEISGRDHVVINTSTAPIIYSKGGSILRQIKGFIGEESFRDGLHHYLSRFAYGNAASHHLWEAFEAVSAKPVAGMMKNWIEQPGHPVIRVHREGRVLSLQQERFTYLPDRFDQVWHIPVNIELFHADGKSEVVRTLLTESRGQVALSQEPVAFKLNAGQTGFYRCWYANRSDLKALGDLVQEKRLSPEDRWGLENDFFAMVRRGEQTVFDYIDFMKHFENETEYLPLVSIADNLFSAYMVMEDKHRHTIAAAGRRLFDRALGKIGLEPQPGEPFTTSLMRDHVLLHAVFCGSEETLAFGRTCFKTLTSGGSVHPDIMKSTMQIGAWLEDEAALSWLKNRFRSSASEHDRMNVLAALACSNTPELVRQALAFVLEEVPERNQFLPIAAACANPKAVGAMWPWYRDHLEQLKGLHPLLYERVIAAIIPNAGIWEPDAVSEFFHDAMDRSPQIRDTVLLALEKLKINLKMKERHG